MAISMYDDSDIDYDSADVTYDGSFTVVAILINLRLPKRDHVLVGESKQLSLAKEIPDNIIVRKTQPI